MSSIAEKKLILKVSSYLRVKGKRFGLSLSLFIGFGSFSVEGSCSVKSGFNFV